PDAVHLHPTAGALLGTFELARPGDEDVTAEEGTAVYLSPEQSRHEILDGRIDLFTVGLLLAETLAAATRGTAPPRSAGIPPLSTVTAPAGPEPTAAA